MMGICEYEEFALNLAVIREGLLGFFDEIEKNPNQLFYWSPLDPNFYEDENIIKDEVCYKSILASYPIYDPTFCVLLELNPNVIFIRASCDSKHLFTIDFYKNKG